MKPMLVLCGAVLLSLSELAVAQASPPGHDARSAQSASQVSFGVLKSLAGSWTGAVTTDPPNPDINGPIQVTMRVASRGSVLVHEIAPGGVPEPTIIYLEGDRLTLVHYCEAGNRPRLVGHKPADSQSVKFEFAELSGSAEPAYLHDFVFTRISADHHTEDWTFMLPGNRPLHAHFDLKKARSADGKDMSGPPSPRLQRTPAAAPSPLSANR